MSKLVFLSTTRLNDHQTLHETSLWPPDFATRHPLFHLSVRLTVRLSTFMPKFDIYVKVSILINYKTKQPSNLAWNISLTSWLCDIGVCFFVCLSVRSSVRLSTFMSKFNVYVKVSILINYKTKQPSKPCMKHLPDLLTLRHRHPLFCPSVCPFVSTFEVRHLRQS